MSRQTTILLVGAATIGAGVGMSSAFAVPADGAVIDEAASTSVTQKVRSWGWRGVDAPRGWGLRGGWDGYRPVYGYGRFYAYGPYGYTIYYLTYGCGSCRPYP